MKFFVVLSAFVAVGFAEYCYDGVVGFCGPRGIVSVTKVSKGFPTIFWSYG